MDVAERVWSVLRGEVPDKVPWLIYSNHLPRGSFEREMRAMGLGLDVRCSVHRLHMPNVKTETTTVGNYAYTLYRTPVGELRTTRRTEMTFQLPNQGSWTMEHPVKNHGDLRAAKFMIEDTVYEPQYDLYGQLEEELEGDGVVTVGGDYTPLMKTIVTYLGFRTFALTLRSHPEELEDLLEALDRRNIDMYNVIARSPARIVRIGDNIDGVMISPALFEKYCLPYYNKYARVLKNASKTVISHMDGRLRKLKGVIARSDLDAIEAFTPPPMGDLPVREAKEAWRGKVLWMNFPEEVFLRSAEEIREYAMSLLKEMAPGPGYIIGITEDIAPAHLRKGIRAVTEVLHEHGTLPLPA